MVGNLTNAAFVQGFAKVTSKLIEFLIVNGGVVDEVDVLAGGVHDGLAP